MKKTYDFIIVGGGSSGLTTTANYMIKKSTGKTITEHAFDAVSNDILKQSYFPKKNQKLIKETK